MSFDMCGRQSEPYALYAVAETALRFTFTLTCTYADAVLGTSVIAFQTHDGSYVFFIPVAGLAKVCAERVNVSPCQWYFQMGTSSGCFRVSPLTML